MLEEDEGAAELVELDVEGAAEDEDEDEDVEQRPGGALSAHFKLLSFMPLQTSSTDSVFPSSTKAYAVGPATQVVSVCVRLLISCR